MSHIGKEPIYCSSTIKFFRSVSAVKPLKPLKPYQLILAVFPDRQIEGDHTLRTSQGNSSVLLQGPLPCITTLPQQRVKYNINLPLKVQLRQTSGAFKVLQLLPCKNSRHPKGKMGARWGALRAHIAKTLFGFYKAHKLTLKFIGVGYKAALYGSILILRLGFSHKLFIKCNKEVSITRTKKRPPTFLFQSPDCNVLKSTAFLLRSFKKPEPYKGKGVVFLNEHLKLKEGKKTK